MFKIFSWLRVSIPKFLYVQIRSLRKEDIYKSSIIYKYDKKFSTFSPETVEQEVLLLLLIADTLQEYVIDRAPEYDEPRFESLSSATHIIDLITVCLSRVNQFFLIAQRLEKTLKFAYQVNWFKIEIFSEFTVISNLNAHAVGMAVARS